NAAVASQLRASRDEIAEMARNNSNVLDQLKATQAQMEHANAAVTARLNTREEQLARVMSNAPEPKAAPDEPKVIPEQPGVIPEQPSVMPQEPSPTPQAPSPTSEAP